MGLLPMDIDILPPSDDRIFKLILTSPKEGKTVIIEGKAGRLDVNCRIQDGTQVNLEIQASRLKEDSGGEHKNLKGKSIYYLCYLHSSQSSKGRRYDRLARSLNLRRR